MIDENNFWEKRYSDNSNYRNRFPFSQIVSLLAKFKNTAPQKLLELGCGSGNNLWAAYELGYECYGIDISKTIINYATKFLIEKSASAELLQASFTEKPYPDSYFDLIIDRSSVHCAPLNEHTKIFRNVYEMLKPGGKFYFNPAADENSSILSSNFPIQRKISDNIYFGKNVNLVYYDETSVKYALRKFNLLEFKKSVHKISNQEKKFVYSEFEVLCEKPKT